MIIEKMVLEGMAWIAVGLIGGIILSAALVAFWDGIKHWLDTVAADWVEQQLGYNARYRMQKAVTLIDRVIQKVRNRAVIYTKKYNNDLYFDKTTIISETGIENIEEDVRKEIAKQGTMVQEFEYRKV